MKTSEFLQCVKCIDSNCDKCYNYEFSSSQGICYLCKYGYSLDYEGSYKCENMTNSNNDIRMCKYHFNFNDK